MENKVNLPKIYIEPCAGLGNRLNAVLGALYWKRELAGQVEIELVWKRETSCNADFFRLFKAIPDLTVHSFFDMGMKPPYTLRTLRGKKIEKSLMESCQEVYEPDEIVSMIAAENGEEQIKKLLTKGKNLFIKSNCGLCYREHQKEVLHMLVPTEEIQGIVRSVTGNYKEENLVGIHIRRTDHIQAMIDSPLELFVDKMTELKTSQPHTRFYLATDDASVEDMLMKEFVLLPHITVSKEIKRNTENGIVDALVDMLCLGRCGKIYGSNNSTFSEMAGVLGGKEVEFLIKPGKD